MFNRPSQVRYEYLEITKGQSIGPFAWGTAWGILVSARCCGTREKNVLAADYGVNSRQIGYALDQTSAHLSLDFIVDCALFSPRTPSAPAAAAPNEKRKCRATPDGISQPASKASRGSGTGNLCRPNGCRTPRILQEARAHLRPESKFTSAITQPAYHQSKSLMRALGREGRFCLPHHRQAS